MISVLSHLLPSNGNKQVMYLLLPVFLTMFSCGAGKSISSTQPEVVPITQPTTPDIDKDTIKDVLIGTIDPTDNDSTPIEMTTKTTYNIVLLLPFNLDRQNYSPFDLQSETFEKSAQMAIEFYQGFQLAINQIEESNIDVEIFVLDSRKDASHIEYLLKQHPFPKVDLMVGPVYNKTLRVAATYCAKNKIPLISPLSSSSSITENNPYYYSANATSASHYETFMSHIHQHYPEDTLHIVHNNTLKEREVIKSLQDINNTNFSSKPTIFNEIALTVDDDFEVIKEQFDSLSNHIVFVPSTKEAFATYALSQLANIKAYFPSVVFGMPNWTNFKNINYDYFEWLEVHLTESYWVNEFNINVEEFGRSFIQTYQMSPSEYAFQGFDLANFVLNNLAMNADKFNTNKDQFFTIDPSKSGLQTKFEFIPRYNPTNNKIDFWDNSYIHMLKFENYTFNKID